MEEVQLQHEPQRQVQSAHRQVHRQRPVAAAQVLALGLGAPLIAGLHAKSGRVMDCTRISYLNIFWY